MPGRRSMTGAGRLSLIYTVGDDDRQPSTAPPVLSVAVGEDFAECSWPTVLKCQAPITKTELLRYVDALAGAVRGGFWMDPRSTSTLFWEWTGTVLPGMETFATPGPGAATARTLGTGHRSAAGDGSECGLYLMDDAVHWHRPGFYGHIRGRTAISASVGEDFAITHWPVVVKAGAGIDREGLSRYLTDLAACIRDGLFVEVSRAA